MSLLVPSRLSSKACVAQRPQPLAAPRTLTMRASARPLIAAEANKRAKPAELRAQFPTAEAILAEVQKLKGEMFSQRIKFAKREEYKPAQYQELRRRVAQLLTIKREREIEQGIDKREARAIEKRRLTEAGLGRL